MSRFRHVMHISVRGQGPHHCLSRGTEQAVVLRRHHGPGRCDLFTAFLAGQSGVRLHITYKIGYEYFLMFCLPRDSVKYTSITIVLFSFSAVSRRLHARNLILGIPTHIMVDSFIAGWCSYASPRALFTTRNQKRRAQAKRKCIACNVQQ